MRLQQRVLKKEREQVLRRKVGFDAGMKRLNDLQSWCKSVSVRRGEFTYEQRRTALDALGVQVRVWRTDHEPRYAVTASIPLDTPTPCQTGQDSFVYAASINTE